MPAVPIIMAGASAVSSMAGAAGVISATTATAVSAGAMAVSAGAQLYNQSQQAHQQKEYQEKANANTLEVANDTYQLLGANARSVQENALESALSNQLAGLEARGATLAEAHASGTGGGVINDTLRDINRNQGRNTHAIVSNREAEMQNINDQAESARQGMISSWDISPVQKPNWVGGLVDIASDISSASTSYREAQELESNLGGV